VLEKVKISELKEKFIKKKKKKEPLKQQFKTFQLSLSLQSTKSHLLKITGQKHKF
jgi:hypothetical protein